MDKQRALEEIESHRAQIDAIDCELVELLNRRETESLAIRRLKPDAGMHLLDQSREDAIFEKIRSLNNGPITDEGFEQIYTTLLRVMKESPDPEAPASSAR